MLRGILDRSHEVPFHPAVQDLGRELSYSELVDEAARLGASLKGRGVDEGDRVAILIPNSVDFVIAALASLWIGAIFVPLAVTDPLARLETVAADCSPVLILSAEGADDVPSSLSGSPVVAIDLLRNESREPADEPDDVARASYLIYTSGTTGTPKGVQIGGSAFASAVWSTARALDMDADVRTLCVSPFHFDGSYANLFPTLVSGGTAIIRPRDTLLYPRTFFKTVETEGVTYSGFTPTYLQLLLASRQFVRLDGSTLKTIALGGEALSARDLETLWSKVPNIRVFNRYGPTECTIAVTNVEMHPDTVRNVGVSIGRPHPGVSFVLVDDDERVIVETHRTGELYVGGAQLMDGYWADAILTASVMRTDIVPGQTLYRTGDLVYLNELGDYVYVDRADRVVKRNGVRISLVELSDLMSRLDGIDSSICLAYDHDGELGIVAFVSTEEELSSVDLRRAARSLIPENMLPDRFDRMSSVPLNRSNQLDESALLSTAGLRTYHSTSSRRTSEN